MLNKIKSATKRCRFFLPYLLIITFSFLILSHQLSSHLATDTFDMFFHMNRFYDTAMQIKTGHFSYFLSFFGFNHVARISNAMYGPAWAYLNGLILLIVKNWYNWEIFESIAVLLISGFSMYVLSRYLNANRIISTIVAYLYMISVPINTWTLDQGFTGVGGAFVPLVILAGVKIVQAKQIHYVKLSLLIVLLSEIHLLTTFISIIALAIFMIFALYKNKNYKKFLLNLSKAIGLTLLLTVNVWGTLLGVLISNKNHFIPTYPVFNFRSDPGQLIEFKHLSLSIGVIYSIIFVLAIIFSALFWKKLSKTMKATLTIAIFFFWISSQWFPWTTLQKMFPGIDSTIQSPRRFYVISLVATLAIISKISSINIFKDLSMFRIFNGICIIGLLILTMFSLSNYQEKMISGLKFTESNTVIAYGYYKRYIQHNPNTIRNDFHSHNLAKPIDDVAKSVTDYLPTSYKFNNIYNYYKFDPYKRALQQYELYHFNCQRKILPHAKDELIFNNTKKNHEQFIPLAKYAHTQVKLNHKIIHPQRTWVGAIEVKPKLGINTISVQYKPATWFKVLIIISIISWLIFIISRLTFITFYLVK